MRTYISILLSLFYMLQGISQANTLVMGKITNNNARITSLDLQVNHRYLDGDITTYESNILADGTFAFAVEIEEPQLINILYARNNALLYLEPNDTLYVNFDANTFKFSFEFSGRSGANNTYLTEFLKKSPRKLDPFQYLQYRWGPYWYKIDPDKDYLMRSKTKTQFLDKIKQERAEGMSNIQFFDLNHKAKLTPNFKAFMEAEIYYDWAYHMLLFGDVYKSTHGLDASFFDFLKEVPLQNDQIGSHWYQLFLMAYINHTYKEKEEKTDNPYVGQYHLADTLLVSKAMAYVQSEMISIGFHKKYIETTLPAYTDFIAKNPYSEFDEKAISSFQKAMKTAVGTPAPDFRIDGGGEDKLAKNLSSLQGKIVVLNFWATWCRPCIKKMKELKPLLDEMENDIVFIHIAFDKDAAYWESFIQKNNYKGLHLLTPAGVDSDVAKKYDVKALPQYFIIDKKGNFGEKPQIFSVENLKASLQYLNR